MDYIIWSQSELVIFIKFSPEKNEEKDTSLSRPKTKPRTANLEKRFSMFAAPNMAPSTEFKPKSKSGINDQEIRTIIQEEIKNIKNDFFRDIIEVIRSELV